MDATVETDLLPLDGVRVVEFTQFVMGPSCGMILADLGAEVIKVEPLPKGDRTRHLTGVASGFFLAFGRNRKSLAVDMKRPEGIAVVKRLIARSDVVIENLKPGGMAAYGLDYASLAADNPGLIYCALKGFLPGPYEHRTALDEVVQMMGGLAHMTGPPGKPMRAGASVNDIMGAMFGVIGIQGALRLRESTGRGQHIHSALFENTVLLMAQAMAYESVSGKTAIPWSVRQVSWPVYDLFDTADGEQIFLSVIGDEAWAAFCRAIGRDELLDDPRLADMASRLQARDWMIPSLAETLKTFTRDALAQMFEELGLPFAPVGKPGDLFDDPHLKASGGLLPVTLPDGLTAPVPALPISLDGKRLGVRLHPPRLGQHSREILQDIGVGEAEIERLLGAGVVKAADPVTA